MILASGFGWGAAGCHGALPGDSPPGSLSPAPFKSGVLLDGPIDAVALAADGSGIYWTSGANELWVLRTGAGAPERLAPGAPPPATCNQAPAPMLGATDVFWTPTDRASIHRTHKDGSGDEIIAHTARAEVAVDADSVYWTAATGMYGEGSGVVLSLPQGAAPDSTPSKRVQVSSYDEVWAIAVLDGSLFWTDMEVVGTTVAYASLRWGPLSDLDGSWSGRAVNLSAFARGLGVAGGHVYAAFEGPLDVTSLARLSPAGDAQTIGTLPDNSYAHGVAVVGDWVLVSADHDTCPQPASLDLDAIPVGGGEPRSVATGLRASAVEMGPGVIFVDASGRLVAMSARDVEAIVTPPASP